MLVSFKLHMKLLYKKVLDQLLKTSYLDNNIYLQDGVVA